MKKFGKSILGRSLVLASLLLLPVVESVAHHSFAMYDKDQAFIMTGVVTRVTPDPAHLTIYFVPLDEDRTAVIRDAQGEPIEWVVEMLDAARVSAQGITISNFPRGSIVSVGLHPLRNGRPGGARGDFGVYKCPENTPPAAGKHCDSVAGATKHGPGKLSAEGVEN